MIQKESGPATRRLVVEDLVKEYTGFAGPLERIAAVASLGWFSGSRHFRALDEINLTIDPGRLVGIIGPNGAGKSTLLRLLCGLSSPTRGRIRFAGSVRSILELGVGFNAELTALENIKYNGLLWGYDASTLKKEADSILDFAGLKSFANESLRTFSTGMQMRLAFSLATHQPADLLLVDEALAVGDASFHQRCFDRFRDYRRLGSIVLVVSHDLAMMADLADDLVLLEQGKIIARGEPAAVVSAYMQSVARSSFADGRADTRYAGGSNGAITAFDLRLLDRSRRQRDLFYAGEEALLEIRLTAGIDLQDITIGFHFHDAKGLRIFGTNTHLLGRSISVSAGKTTVFHCRIRLNAGPGAFTCGLSVHRGRTHASDCYLWEDVCLDFRIEPEPGRISDGTAFFDPRWEDED